MANPYAPPRVGFREGIANVGDSFVAARDASEKRRKQKTLEQLFAGGIPMKDGVPDYGSMVQMAAEAGQPDVALKLATLESERANKGAMTPYQTQSLANQEQSLDIQRRRLAGGNVPIGYERDPNDPNALRPQEGGPASKLPPNTAGALAMMQTGQSELDRPVTDAKEGEQPVTARTILSDPTQWSQGQQMQSFMPETMSFFGKTDVVNAQAAVRTNVEAALRMMTGAAAPEQEVERYAAMFTPTWNDTKDRAEAKLRRLDKFTTDAIQLATAGRLQDGATQQKQQQFQEGATATNPQTGQKIMFRGGQWIPAQ